MSVELGSTPTAQERSNVLSPKTRRAFCFPSCFASRRRSVWWERVRSTSWSQLQSQPRPSGDRWWSRALNKLRDWSEIVAGPRWKTFIRRFNRGGKRVAANYQYDPMSYALNFDEGHNGDFQDNTDERFRNFSARYATAVNVNVKSVTTEVSEGKKVEVLV